MATNKAMLKVFESAAGEPIQAVMDSGIYELTIPFAEKRDRRGSRCNAADN
ncbi:MAG: hypothetical protein ABIE47_14195 [Pseudomonadota bacterium]